MSKISKKDKVVFIGKKPFMNYINAVQVQLKKSSKVVIKARGKFTSRAIDVTEYCKRKLAVKTPSIVLGSEVRKDKDEREVNVSTIEITVVDGFIQNLNLTL